MNMDQTTTNARIVVPGTTSNSTVDRTSFQKERDMMLNNVLQSLEQVNTNMSLLSKNLESVIAVGKDFENVAALWKNFNTAIVDGGTDPDLKEKGKSC
ncbi:hypothetical protein G9A89_013772 [Geosiphon pyriformis]|nr:hypothetical protein G9A89_013772 [Geosiphon pyriformis]